MVGLKFSEFSENLSDLRIFVDRTKPRINLSSVFELSGNRMYGCSNTFPVQNTTKLDCFIHKKEGY
jgi:hypothetical protein